MSSSPRCCAICNALEAKNCASCRSSAYCSSQCQRADWRVHKTLCKALQDLPPRPTTSHKLAILFPVETNSPQLIWYECERKVDVWGGEAYGEPAEEEERAKFDIENLSRFMGNDDPPVQYMPFQVNPLKQFELDHTLNIVCCEAHLIDGSSLNRSILEVTKGKTHHDWRGAVIVLRQIGNGYQPYSFYEDMTLADLHHAVNYVLFYGAGFKH